MKQQSFFDYLKRQSPPTPRGNRSNGGRKNEKRHLQNDPTYISDGGIVAGAIPSKTNRVLKRSDLSGLKGRTTHGGVPTKGQRKLARPFSSKKWTHLILKSNRAKGNWSLLKPANKIFIEALIHEKAKKFGVLVDRFVNVGNHIHLKLKCSSKRNFQRFLKALTCLIARFVTKAKRGNPVGPFWQGLAFTRVLKSYFEEKQLLGYLDGNEIEALFGSKARESFLSTFNQWLYQFRQVQRNILFSSG